ncbi:MAG TPA: hypothetical protein VF820_01205, partial [Patescibacteria group bacterium]
MKPLREHSPARLFAETAGTVFVLGMGLSTLSTMTFPGRGRTPELISYQDYLSRLTQDRRAILGALGNPFLRIGTTGGEEHVVSTATEDPIIDLRKVLGRLSGLMGRHRTEQQAADAEAQAQRLVIQVEQSRSLQIARVLQLTATDPVQEVERLVTQPTGQLV